MNTSILPGIIQQRWAAAVQAPSSIPQWRSIACWLEDFAGQCQGHPNTDPLVPELRRMAEEAWGKMHDLQRVPELEGVAA